MSAEGRAAVIGAGIFGCAVALELARAGFAVSLFERRPEILTGATRNNLNRVHLGFHYPRHLGTARQSAAGYQPFVESFGDAVLGGFPNAYFVADEGSLTAPADYLAFCRRLGVPFEVIEPGTFEVAVRGCEAGIRCAEPVYDPDRLARLLGARIADEPALTLVRGAPIAAIEPRGDGHGLRLADGAEAGRFDAVVNCGYADINRLTGQLGLPLTAQQFEYTVVAVIEADLSRLGFAVMDGPFSSLLPDGASGRFLLYDVEHSVVARMVDTVPDAAWWEPREAPFAAVDREAHFARMRAGAARFVPALGRARLVRFLEGPRMVLAGHDDDDARPSQVRDYGGGYLTVFSGKVDHAVTVAAEVRERLLAPRATDSAAGANANV